jgi:hypothetical protein
MGVGLEAGLAVDAIFTDLSTLLDRAERAALSGNLDELSASITGLAERMFAIRPFVPDVDLPTDWRALLRLWLAGTEAVALGADNMRVIEDAFVYRLVWAIEAIRMRRRASGITSAIVEGGAAATLEAGLPRAMMAMLVRAGLPSRVAAMIAIRDTNPLFITANEMREWLRSTQIAALSAQPDWPTSDTAAIWKEFRNEALSGSATKWFAQDWTLSAVIPAWVSSVVPSRIAIEPGSGAVSITTPDHKPVLSIRHRLAQYAPNLLRVEYAADRQSARIFRLGRGEATWKEPA